MLLGTVQAPCQGVMWLGDLAQFAGCQVMHFGADYGPGGIGLLLQPLLGEAIQLESTQTITTADGDSLAVLAGRHGTTETKLRSLNPLLQQSQPYFAGEGETLSSVAAEHNLCLSLVVPGYLPSTQLPAGEWIYLPSRRFAAAVEEGVESLG